MQDSPKNDVNLTVLGTGCATSCGTGCVSFLLLMLVTTVIGVQAVRHGYGLSLVGFPLGMVSHLVVGYVTAQVARDKDATVNTHVLILGSIIMIIGLFGLLTSEKNATAFGIQVQVQAVNQLLGILNWMLTIPLMLLGASWSADDKS